MLLVCLEALAGRGLLLTIKVTEEIMLPMAAIRVTWNCLIKNFSSFNNPLTSLSLYFHFFQKISNFQTFLIFFNFLYYINDFLLLFK
jgi:hypothetical protein